MAAAVISILCFLCIIAVTVFLLIRDSYIKKDFEARVEEVANKINDVNMFKYNADKSQMIHITNMEDTMNYVQKNYVKKEDIANGVTTDKLVVKNMKTDYARIKDAEVEGSLHSNNFGIMPGKGTRKECVIMEQFENLVPQGYGLSKTNGKGVEKLVANDFQSAKSGMSFLTLDDGYFKKFASGSATIDDIKSKTGKFDTSTSDRLTAQGGTLNQVVITDSVMNNSVLNGTIGQVTSKDLTNVTNKSSDITTKTLYTPQGDVVTVTSKEALMGNLTSKVANINSVSSSGVTADSVTTKTMTGDKLYASTTNVDTTTGKSIISDEFHGVTGKFDNLYADYATFGTKVVSSSGICINEDCLDENVITGINNNPPGGINNNAKFRGGTSLLNPKNLGTSFPDADNRNVLRGDTNIAGHVNLQGNADVYGQINMIKDDPGTMIGKANSGIGQYTGGAMRTYAPYQANKPSTVGMSFAREDGSFNDVLSINNEMVASVNGRLNITDAMTFDKTGLLNNGNRDLLIQTGNKNSYMIDTAGNSTIAGNLMFPNWSVKKSDEDIYIGPKDESNRTTFAADGSLINRQGKVYVGDNLSKGGSLYFGGTQNNNTYDTTVMENRQYAKGSELLVFKGGESGKDGLRLRGGDITLDVYDSASKDRTAENPRGRFTADGLYIDSRFCFGTGDNPVCIDKKDVIGIKENKPIIGDTGDAGVIGLSGEKGGKGDRGDQGLRGFTGPEGIKGLTGDKGITGDKGGRGDQGLPGVMDSKSVINASGGMSTGAPVNFSKNDPGSMIEKNMGADNNRYGVGQYGNGVTRVYTAGGFQPATLNLSLAQDNNAFDDVVQIKASDRSTTFNGPVIAKNGLLVSGDWMKTGPNLTKTPQGWGGGMQTWDVYSEGTVGVGKDGNLISFMNSGGDANFTGLVKSGKNLTNMPNGWALGGVQTTDVYAEGTLGLGTNKNINASINNTGDAMFPNTIKSGKNLTNVPDVWKNGGLLTSDLYAEGNIGIGTKGSMNTSITSAGDATFKGGMKAAQMCVDDQCIDKALLIKIMDLKEAPKPPPNLYDFSSHTFTNCGATGINGPTLSQCRSTYSSAAWTQDTTNNYLNMVQQGIQLWTVPVTAKYQIVTMGGSGGRNPNYMGGLGSILQAEVQLNKGDILKILVGQGGTGKSDNCNTGAGGGTFVTYKDNTPIIIAGGGGGTASVNGQNAVTTRNGGTATQGSAGGTNGAGGNANQGPSGAGYSGNGAAAQWGDIGGTNNGIAQSFINGGQGGSSTQQSPNVLGGFGGGASGHGNCCIGGGGGGGYSGGGGAASCQGGGGGGSFIIASANNVNTSNGTYDGSSTFNGSSIVNLNSWNTQGSPSNGAFAPSGSVIITKL